MRENRRAERTPDAGAARYVPPALPTGQGPCHRLWKEQDGVCAYSLRRLDVERLFEPGYVDVDHIVPYSLSFDDRRSNKVLVLSSENRQRATACRCNTCRANGAKTLSSGQTTACTTTASARTFCAKLSLRRRSRGAFGSAICRTRSTWRAFCATTFPTILRLRGRSAWQSVFADQQRRYVAFAQALGAFQGARGRRFAPRWTPPSSPATDGMIRRISGYYGHIEGNIFGTPTAPVLLRPHKGRFPAPWLRFRDELIVRLSSSRRTASGHQPGILLRIWHRAYPPGVCFRMPRRKVTGPGHKETIRAPPQQTKALDGAQGPDRAETGQRRRNQRLLYALQRYAAVRRLIRRSCAALAATVKRPCGTVYKPKADGTPGPLVRKVKTTEKPRSPYLCTAERPATTRWCASMFLVPGDGYYWCRCIRRTR